MVQLRGYQQRGADDIRGAFRTCRAVLYVLATGGGKTFTFSYIGQSAAAKGNAVLILVHRSELLEQSSLSLASLGVRHGIIAPPKKIKQVNAAHFEVLGASFLADDQPVWVASVQTFVRRLSKWAHTFRLVIVDEAHHAVAGQWAKSIEACNRAHILGVTATPTRTDGLGLGRAVGGQFDVMVQGPSTRDLIDSGHLVQPTVYAPPLNVQWDQVTSSSGKLNEKKAESLIDTPTITGDAVDHYKKLLGGKPTIAFCSSIDHANHVAMGFRGAGYRSVAVSGRDEDGDRRRKIAGLANGSIDVLTACDIISEGTDIPAVTGAILLRHTDSESLYLQQVGRVLRPSPGKDRAIILDHVGNCLRHGLPDEEREWSLDGRRASDRSRGPQDKPVTVSQCPKCFTCHEPSPSCPACGHFYPLVKEREIKQVEGDLQEMKADEAELRRRESRRQVGKAKTREELEKIAQERGYKAKWVDHMLKIRTQQGRATA